MTWTVRRVVKEDGDANAADAHDFLNTLADAVVSANSDWSHTPAATYQTTRAGVILTHTDGAEIVIAVSWTGDVFSAANGYLGVESAQPYRAGVAFKPSSKGGSFAALTDANNPFTLATYVSDADAYAFQETAFGDDATQYNAAGAVDVLAHDDSATLVIIVTSGPTQTHTYLMIFADDGAAALNFEHLDDPTDDEPSFLITSQADSSIWDQTGGTAYTSFKCAFRPKGGAVVLEGALLRIRSRDLTWAYQGDDGCLACEQFFMIREADDDWQQGRKGLVDPQILGAVRPDVVNNVELKFDGWRLLHVQDGNIVGWQVAAGPIL